MALTPYREWPPFDVEKNSTADLVIKLYKEDGDEFALAAGDVVRFKMWPLNEDGSAPTLDLDSVGATAGGSIVTIDDVGVDGTTAAQVTVRIAQSDTVSLAKGEYRWELAQVDDSETAPADAYKVAGRGVINLTGSATGDRGKT